MLRDLRGRADGTDALRVQATALQSAANGIVITDRSGIIAWVNPAACAITGYAADELVGQHTRLLKSGEHGPGFYSGIWRTVLRGETWSGTIINRRKDGSFYHEEQTIAPVVDAAGRSPTSSPSSWMSAPGARLRRSSPRPTSSWRRGWPRSSRSTSSCASRRSATR